MLNSDDHANFLRKQNRNPADYRPDIIHQVLWTSWYSYAIMWLTRSNNIGLLNLKTQIIG